MRDLSEIPLPDLTTDPQWYGEIWLQYPLSQKIWPMHLSYVRKAVIDLRIIMNDVAFEFFSGPEPQKGVPLKTVFDFKSRLDSWFHTLPDLLTSRMIVLPCHFVFQ